MKCSSRDDYLEYPPQVTILLLFGLGITGSTAVGLWSRQRWPIGSEQLSEGLIRFVLWVVMAPCVFVNVAHFELASGAGLGLLVGLGALVAGGLLAWLVSTRALRLPKRSAGAVICCSIVANTGYYGLPATLILYGSGAVAGAAAWDSLLTGPVTFLAGFGVGAAYGAASGNGFGPRLRYFARSNPVLWVLPVALVFPSSAIPDWALHASQLAFVVLLPVGFYVLGVNLAHGSGEAPGRALVAPVATAVAIRLAVIPGLFLLASSAIATIPESYFVQAAAPAGINSLIVASVFDLDRRLTATAVAITTALAMLGAVLAGTFG